MYHSARDARGPEKFEAVLAEWTGWECTIRRITLEIEDEDDALEVAADISPAGWE